MKRKLVGALLSIAMVMTLVTGCGDNAANNEAATNNAADTTEVEEAVVEEVAAEALPEAAYYFSFDGEAEGAVVKVNDFTSEGAITVDTRIVDGTNAILYTDGVMGQCVYLDGSYGIELPIDPVGDTYTLSFWMNAARFSDFGPSVQYGQDLYSENASARWVNFTKTTFPGEDTFPVVWSRDEAADLWPWFDAADNTIYGKKEWVNITMVVDPAKMTEDGMNINADIYINGELMDKENPIVPGTMTGDDTFRFFLGINCWDTIFKGAFDELYVFNQALTAGQVATLFQAGDPTVELVAPESETAVEEVDYTRTDIVADAAALETVGTPDCTMGFWSNFSNGVEIADGASKTITFNNYSDGAANWDNYVGVFASVATTSDVAPSADNYAGYAEYAVVRADLFGWGYAEGAATYEASWGDDWAAFANMIKNAKVALTITREGSVVTMDTVFTDMVDGTEYTSKGVITTAAEGDMYFFLTGEKCYLEVLSVE